MNLQELMIKLDHIGEGHHRPDFTAVRVAIPEKGAFGSTVFRHYDIEDINLVIYRDSGTETPVVYIETKEKPNA